MDPNISYMESVGIDRCRVLLLDCASLSGQNTSITTSQRRRAGRPSRRTPVSRAIISASEVECETAPCFLQIQLMGTKVLGPTRHKMPPEVDLESRRSPAKLASEKKTR